MEEMQNRKLDIPEKKTLPRPRSMVVVTPEVHAEFRRLAKYRNQLEDKVSHSEFLWEMMQQWLTAHSEPKKTKPAILNDGPISIGPIYLDPVERVVLVDGVQVELTSSEFALLSYLMRNAERTVSRSEILEQVWQTNFDPRSNLIEVHVTHLREKLRHCSSLLETIRGHGYRFNVHMANKK